MPMMAPAYPKKPPVKPGCQMRQLHWGKIPDIKIKGTMWDNDLSEDNVKVDKEELEKFFAAAQAKAAPIGGGGDDEGAKAKSKKAEVVTLVDPKTANNTAIALSRFKLTPAEIAQALLEGDEKKLKEETLSALQGILPAAEEVELCQGYDGPREQLGKAEQFFLAIAQVPRYTIRTKCMLVRSSFPERITELSLKIEDVAEAVKEIRSSKALRMVLEHALAIGNYLNGGTNKGAAWGFKLDSLNKLIGTKTADGKSTLLHYLARKLADKDAVEGLFDELVHVEGAARVEWKETTSELSSLGSALKQVQTQVKLDKNASFTQSMGAFHTDAQRKIEAAQKAKEGADKAVADMIKWMGEDAKTQPEELFSSLNNFTLTLEKGHRFNLDCDEKERKKARMDAAAAQKKGGGGAANRGSVHPGGAPKAGVGVDSELAAKIGKRNNLVDGARDNMANGIRSRGNK